MTPLLSRHAEAIFWLARYVERTENLARILDVNETFSRNSLGQQNWAAVLQIYADADRFKEERGEPTTEDVLHFYTLDRENPSSIASQLKAVRENARLMRPLISTEMWTQINTFHSRVSGKRRADVSEENLSKFCALVKEGCQTHTGITEGTFMRDEAFYIYQAGRMLERADQTTRLLDVKYHLLLPSPADVGSGLDVSQWNALLRSAAGYHAFRRAHPRGMTPSLVAAFMIFNPFFARSVRGCIVRLAEFLDGLEKDYGISPSDETSKQLKALTNRLETETIEDVIRQGLHEFLDTVQGELNRVGEEIARSFFAKGTG